MYMTIKGYKFKSQRMDVEWISKKHYFVVNSFIHVIMKGHKFRSRWMDEDRACYVHAKRPQECTGESEVQPYGKFIYHHPSHHWIDIINYFGG